MRTHWIAAPIPIVFILAAPVPVFAQENVESVAGDIWLGGSLFTVEDLENLDDAVKLKPEQKDAALELMRGAMARARTMSLKYYRGWNDQDWSEDESDSTNAAHDYQKKMQDQMAEVVKLEKEVMSDLKALLENEQADLGWQRFERSRRRLIIRGAQQIVQQLGYSEGSHFAMAYGMQEPLIDVIALARSSKLTPAERAPLNEVFEPYETSMDSLVNDWRPFAKDHGNMMMWYMPDRKQPSEADKDKMQDLVKRMRQLQIRTARKVEEALTGAALERFQRQRLRRESQYRWMPAKRSPDVAAVLKLRSLTTDQKGQIDGLIKEADSQLLKFAIDDRHKMDESVLSGKEPTPEEMYGQGNAERYKQEQKLRRKLTKDVLALLTADQRTAYDTGIENEQDLVQAFDKRRSGSDNPWEMDADLNPWMDYWQQQQEDE